MKTKIDVKHDEVELQGKCFEMVDSSNCATKVDMLWRRVNSVHSEG